MNIQIIREALSLLAEKASFQASILDRELILAIVNRANDELDRPVHLVIIRNGDNVDELDAYGDAPITIVTDVEVEDGWKENVQDAMNTETDPSELNRMDHGISIEELAVYPLSHMPNELEYATGIPRK